MPSIAVGLAPLLAMGVHQFGLHNMGFIVLMAGTWQALAWWRGWDAYVLKWMPAYLIEGLLAGLGLSLIQKFLSLMVATVPSSAEATLASVPAWQMGVLSTVTLILFLVLVQRYQKTSPAVPYAFVLFGGILLGGVLGLPKLHLEAGSLLPQWPLPHYDTWLQLLGMMALAILLGSINLLDQVMCHTAVVRMDAVARPNNSSHSLIPVWLTSVLGSVAGGMPVLDVLGPTATNINAGSSSKWALPFVALVMGVVLLNQSCLTLIPKYSLAVLMLFAGWKMLSGLFHIPALGAYPMAMAVLCTLSVWQLGLLEGLILALGVHYAIQLGGQVWRKKVVVS